MTRRTAMRTASIFGLALALPGAFGEEVYVVQKNDTLSSIAEKYGLGVKQLASHNGIDKPDNIRAGQRLKIPGRNITPKLSSKVQDAIDKAKVRSGKWKYVIIHHSATDVGTARGMDEFHRKERHMENGLAYHFVIGNGRGMDDGEVAVGGRWTAQLDGGHLHSEFLNAKSLGICLVGKFDEKKPTEKQMESLHALTMALLKRCKLTASSVKTHQQIHKINRDRFTLCPGKHFPIDDLLKALRA